MPAPLTLIKVNPIGYHQSHVLMRGGFREIKSLVYPPSPNGYHLGEGRRRGYNLREAARLLGIRSHELSKLETGELTLSDEEWKRVFELLEIKDPSDAKPKPAAAAVSKKSSASSSFGSIFRRSH